MAARGKNRKGGSGPSASSPSVARWTNSGDIPLDEEESFHAGRDKVLLNGRQADEESDEDIGGGQREVLSLGSDEEDTSISGDGEDDSDDQSDEDDPSSSKPRQYKRLEKEKAAKEAAQISDDEDVGLSDDDSDGDTTRWGANKKAYYNTNDLDKMEEDSDIDEEEARRMELNEVKKLQARSRKGMDDADFGLGEADAFGGAEEGGKGVKDRHRRRMELDGLNEPSVPPPNGPFTSDVDQPAHMPEVPAVEGLPEDPRARAGLLANLQKVSPETVALAGEYADAVDQLVRVESTLAEVSRTQPKHPALGMMHLHYQALYTYVTTLTFYFYLRASPRYSEKPAELSHHPVLKRILKLKEGLSTMEDLGFSVPLDGDDEDDEDDVLGNAAEQSEVEDDVDNTLGLPIRAGGVGGGDGASDEDDDEDDLGDLDDDELDRLIADEKENQLARAAAAGPSTQPGSSSASRPSTSAKEAKAAKPKKSKKTVQDNPPAAVRAPLAGLLDAEDSIDLTRGSKGKSASASSSLRPDVNGANGEAYGEATSMTTSDQEDKAAKKRSLRFYTGQIDAKEARRGQAARERMGGDLDLPYRDRDRSRQAVEQARASKEGKLKSAEQTALDDAEWGEGDAKDWRDVMGKGKASGDTSREGNDDADDDYYDLVSSGRQAAKRAKKDAHDAERDASRIIEDTEITEPGSHRAINRQISTNRGLTPHRKQDRNLRVKKRKKYEKAQKKLSSTRAVYTGGQGALQGGYQGEKSGINTSVSKSRRFAS